MGWALTVLNNACRYTVGLTGTLFGGYSSHFLADASPVG